MKTLIISYSYTGKTKALAARMAEAENAELREVRDPKRPSVLKAYVLGSFAAMRMKSWPSEWDSSGLADYERIILMAPIWAGHPAPQINSVIAVLPPDIQVEFIVVSAGGDSGCKDKVEAAVKDRGCSLTDFKNVKGQSA